MFMDILMKIFGGIVFVAVVYWMYSMKEYGGFVGGSKHVASTVKNLFSRSEN